MFHERRVVSSGTILEPRSDPATWEASAQLDLLRGSTNQQPLPDARRFADGLSSWLLRRTDLTTEWMVFNRPAGSERDLVVLASVFDATIVQRHPAGAVRVVGAFGVLPGMASAGITSRPSSRGSAPSMLRSRTATPRSSRTC
jgi:hypothetical protein